MTHKMLTDNNCSRFLWQMLHTCLWSLHQHITWYPPSPPLDNIRVMMIVWRLTGNIIRTALFWIVWHNVHSPQHTYMSSSYRSNRLGLSHWEAYAVHRGSCLELYYCNMVEWFWWYSSLILTAIWFPSLLWHCWFGHPACKSRPRNDLLCVEWDVKPYTLTHPSHFCVHLYSILNSSYNLKDHITLN